MKLAAVIALAACGCQSRAPLYKAGDEKDDGAGLLARASTRLAAGEDHGPAGFDKPVPHAGYGYGGDAYGGDAYGGGMYGGDPYGGSTYASWVVPQWNYTAPNRMPRYEVAQGLSGAIEGTVKWTGAAPGTVTSACGAIDNPTLRVGNDKGMRGVVVYIERTSVGRPTPYYGRPASVGGMLAKRGCALVPAVQIVMPLPASIAIHGDGQRARVRVAAKVFELQEGGLVQVEVKAGVTKVDGEDGKLGAAWVLGLETPYYAITDDSGRFRIDELGPGTYDVTIWQPPVASVGLDGVWTYGAPIVVHRSVKVEAGKPTQLSVPLR